MEDLENVSVNELIIDFNAKVSPIVLATILGVNISLIYQESQAGRLPISIIDSTYKECIQMYITHFKKNQDLKLAKEQNEQELRLAKIEETNKLKLEKEQLRNEESRNKGKRSFGGSMDDEGDSMHPLLKQKITQEIRVNIAREAQMWLKIATERQEFVSYRDKLELVTPFIISIRDLLLGIASDFPEIQSKVDEGMESLYQVGVKLLQEAEIDKDSYVQAMLDKDIEVEDV